MMPSLSLVAVVVVSAGLAQPAQAPGQPIDRLAWLAGCWSYARPDGLTEEHWTTPSGGTMLGMGRTVRAGRTTEFEFLQIREIDGKLAFLAKPSGQADHTFPVKSLSDTELVFEDLAHDFPQRIIYRRTADGSLAARVEGMSQGQVKGIDYPYKPCR